MTGARRWRPPWSPGTGAVAVAFGPSQGRPTTLRSARVWVSHLADGRPIGATGTALVDPRVRTTVATRRLT